MIKYLGLTCGIFGLDGIIKKWIDERKEKPEITLKKFRIICCRNKGAMYSLGEETPDRVRRISAFILTGVAMHWIYVVTSRKKNSIEKIGASLWFGGSLSNVWDRFTRKYVVDYIHIDVKLLRKIIFNISDVCIIIGGCISMLANVIRFLKEE